MRVFFFTLYCLLSSTSCFAQEIVGFPREDFGKVVLSGRQAMTGSAFEASIGDYKNEPISGYGLDSPFAQLGRPVGRLDILTNIRVFPCTGFLISERYILTNHHCVTGLLDVPQIRDLGAKRIEAIQFVLGYVQEGVLEKARRFNVSPVPIEEDRSLDYAILEVFGAPSEVFGKVDIAALNIKNNRPLWVIGHPLGEHQKISREGCKSASPAVSGGRLRHQCDTLPGNSGSPVIDAFTHKVVALHHAGSSQNSINYAVPLAELVKKSTILKSLAGAQVAVVPAPRKVDTPSAATPAVGIYPEKKSRLPFEPEMVSVPGGTFKMGCVSGIRCDDDEKPVRSVTLKPFEMGKYEVTQDQFQAFVDDTGYKTGNECWVFAKKWEKKKGYSYRNPGYSQSGSHPVVCVSWDDAVAYAKWLSQKTGKTYRLPTEAEWEYAARAGTQTKFSFGDRDSDVCEYANGADSSTDLSWANKKCSDGIGRETAEVGQYKKNAFGLYDMHGNVLEWTQDCWHKNYKGAPKDGSAWLKDDGGNCAERVLRGGSWFSIPYGLRAAYRSRYDRDSRNSNYGFRLSRTLTP